MSWLFTAVSVLLIWKLFAPLCWTIFKYTFGKRLWSVRKELKGAGEWAIVTGSTDGIGKAYAEELAKDGLKVMLISRNPDKLKQVADHIETRYKVETKTYVADFTKTDIYDGLEEEIGKLKSIACLVNNVGMSYPFFEEYAGGGFLNMEFVQNLIACNVNSAVCLTRIILPKLLKQTGTAPAIINVSSASGVNPSPFLSLYAGSKACVLRFTESVAYEQTVKIPIHIQCVCPFFVATAMSKIRRTSMFVPTPQDYASSALDMLGVETTTYGYLTHAFQGIALSILPHVAITYYSRRLMTAQRRKRA